MDLTKLRYFTVVAETGSLREAAEVLNISSAAVSKAISSLEQQLDLNLIESSGRGIRITADGNRVARNAGQLFTEYYRFENAIANKIVDEDRVRLATFEVFSTYFAGEIAQKYLPDSEIDLLETIPGELESAVASGRADIGITYLPVPHRDLDLLKVAQVEMGIYGLKKVFGKYSFDDLPFAIPISPLSEVPTKVKGLDSWPEDRVQRKVKYRVTMMESALDFCRRGRADSFLPSFIADLHNEQASPKTKLDRFPLPEGMKGQKHSIYLIKRKVDSESTTIKKIAKALRLTCKL